MKTSILIFAIVLLLDMKYFDRWERNGFVVSMLDSCIAHGDSKQAFEDEFRTNCPLPHVAGTVDVFPVEQGAAIAAGMDYFPRPALQSFGAYTPALAELDAAHLRGTNAPDNIFFRIENLDGHYPSLDDGLCWPELISRYESTYVNEQFTLLKRSKYPHAWTKTLYASGDVAFNQPIPVNAGLVWAEIDVEKSFYGKVMSQLYKPPGLTISFAIGSQTGQLKLVPGMAKAGFLVSPFVNDTGTFERLFYHDEIKEKQLTEFAIGCIGDSDCYEPQIHVRLYRLEFK